MRAILLAAGCGSRLGTLTANRPKCLVPLYGQAMLDHTLVVLRSCGIEDLVVVTGYKRAILQRHLLGQSIIFCQNPRYRSTNMVESLFCARKFLDRDVVISYTDIVYGSQIVWSLLNCPAPASIVVDREWELLWRLRHGDPLKDAETLKLNEDGSVRVLGGTPLSLSEIEGQYIGLIRLKRQAIAGLTAFFDALAPEKQATISMTEFLQLAIQKDIVIQAAPVHGGWAEIDTKADLKAIEGRFDSLGTLITPKSLRASK